MNDIIMKFAGLVDKVGEAINLHSTSGSIVIGLLIIFITAILIGFIWKMTKKAFNKGVAILLIIVILVCSGILTLGQFRNFLEASGNIVSEGWASSSEEGGSAFIYWMQDMINDEDSDVGGFDFSQDGTW